MFSGTRARADGSTSLRRLDGSPLHSHFFGQSSFASYSVCTANALVKVPDDADAALLGPLACGISTGAGAVLNAATHVIAAVHDICGRPADFSLDCAGNVKVLRQTADSVGIRGTVALIGGAPPSTG